LWLLSQSTETSGSAAAAGLATAAANAAAATIRRTVPGRKLKEKDMMCLEMSVGLVQSRGA
jgi:hypothetical protein